MANLTLNPSAPLAPQASSLRSLAPDLSRGFMLLLIAIVHASVFRAAWGEGEDGGYLVADPLDMIVSGFVTLFVDDRGFALFAALFGYGAAQVYQRMTKEGREWPVVRALVRRRGRWLVIIGLAHTVLLAFGEILAVYGLVALAFVGALRYSERKLLKRAVAWFAGGTLVYAFGIPMVFMMLSSGATDPAAATPLTDLTERLGWIPMMPLVFLNAVFPFLVGIWAARRRLLEEPERHQEFLRKVAVYGISASVVLGAPYALTRIGVLDAGVGGQVGFYWLNLMVSFAGGFGYAAVIALISIRISKRQRRGPVVTALVATGQRSMTFYLLQSVAWLVLGAPYMLGLGNSMSDLGALGMGVAVWLFTVLVADYMGRKGIRGPAEVFYRRMTYRNAKV
jgi:uncharacterized membrane protein YeiB